MSGPAVLPAGKALAVEPPAVLGGRKNEFWKALLAKEPKVKMDSKPYAFLARMPREQMDEIQEQLNDRREIREATAASLAKIFTKINGDDIVELMEYAERNCNSGINDMLEKQLYRAYAHLPEGAKTEALNDMMRKKLYHLIGCDRDSSIQLRGLLLINGLPEEMLDADLKRSASRALSDVTGRKKWDIDTVRMVIGLPESMRTPALLEKAREKYTEIVSNDSDECLEAIKILPDLPEEFRTKELLDLSENAVLYWLDPNRQDRIKERAFEAIPVLSRYINSKKMLSAAKKAMYDIVKGAKRETVISMLSDVGSYPQEVQGSIVRATLFSEYPSIQIRAFFKGIGWLVSRIWKSGNAGKADFPHIAAEEGEDE